MPNKRHWGYSRLGGMPQSWWEEWHDPLGSIADAGLAVPDARMQLALSGAMAFALVAGLTWTAACRPICRPGKSAMPRRTAPTGERERDSRGESRKGPPQLRLRLWQRLKLLLILNTLPILATAWLGWHAAQGQLRLTVEAAPLMWLVVAILGGCAAILVSLWVVLPTSRWLAAWPTWHMYNRSAIVWALPSLIGHLLAAAFALVALGIIGTAIAVIVISFNDLSKLEPNKTSTDAPDTPGETQHNPVERSP